MTHIVREADRPGSSKFTQKFDEGGLMCLYDDQLSMFTVNLLIINDYKPCIELGRTDDTF